VKNLSWLKPGADVQTHLLIAASLWSFIGIYLLIRGLLLFGSGPLWQLAAALLLGGGKGYFVLDKAARRNIKRIKAFDQATCIGAVYTWKMWLLVVLMMFSGRYLRSVHDLGPLVGLLYVAVGWGLFFASRLFWQSWRP